MCLRTRIFGQNVPASMRWIAISKTYVIMGIIFHVFKQGIQLWWLCNYRLENNQHENNFHSNLLNGNIQRPQDGKKSKESVLLSIYCTLLHAYFLWISKYIFFACEVCSNLYHYLYNWAKLCTWLSISKMIAGKIMLIWNFEKCACRHFKKPKALQLYTLQRGCECLQAQLLNNMYTKQNW